jgi:putative flippase GtrA
MLKKKFFSDVPHGSSAQTKQQAILFLFVGMVNTLFGYSCFALFIFLGVHYAFAALMATCIGVLFNFHTTGRIVFKNSKHHLIFKFIGVYAFLYCLNVTALKLLQPISTNYYFTGFITVIPLAALSFLLNKYLVFHDRHPIN